MEPHKTPLAAYPQPLLKVINLIMIGYAIISFTRVLIFDLIFKSSYTAYSITDWLINYQAGFVRRGLLGEILFHVSKATHLSPKCIIISICALSLGIVLYLLIKQFRKQDLCWWILPLNICLAGADFLRKDFLCMLFVIAAIISYVKIHHTWARFICINLLLIISLNFHESVFFIICPFLVLANWRDTRIESSPCWRTLFLVPTMLVFGALSLFKGNAAMAQTIHHSWQIAEMGYQPAATIASLSWDFAHTLNFHIEENFLSPKYPIYGKIEKPLLWLLTFAIFPCILFSKKAFHHTTTQNFINVFIVQFISLFPMLTLLSCDQSRIFFYWTCSTLCIFAFVPEKTLTGIFPVYYTRICAYAHKICFSSWVGICAVPLLFIICISPYSTKPAMAFSYSVAGTYSTCFVLIREVTPVLWQHSSFSDMISSGKKRIETVITPILE